MKLCPTRWVERHDAVIVFIEFLPLIFEFLEAENTAEAYVVLRSVQSAKFLVGTCTGIFVPESVMVHTIQPSKLLQGDGMDISSAVKTMADVTATIKHLREEADRAFEEVFARISAVVEAVSYTHLTLPTILLV